MSRFSFWNVWGVFRAFESHRYWHGGSDWMVIDTARGSLKSPLEVAPEFSVDI